MSEGLVQFFGFAADIPRGQIHLSGQLPAEGGKQHVLGGGDNTEYKHDDVCNAKFFAHRPRSMSLAGGAQKSITLVVYHMLYLLSSRKHKI